MGFVPPEEAETLNVTTDPEQTVVADEVMVTDNGPLINGCAMNDESDFV